ncbi:hypothetical protein [Streptomyces malaysiensis]|uniref:hypothetical protein n=1 Tax=Streptomyces malaysiensis TaxID=92644 RepID=UPI0036BAD357
MPLSIGVAVRVGEDVLLEELLALRSDQPRQTVDLLAVPRGECVLHQAVDTTGFFLTRANSYN